MVVYADSEEVQSENGGADLVFDLQFTTVWHTQWADAQPGHPHQVVIDLGAVHTAAGLRYLPRQNGENGRVKDYRVFLGEKPYPGL